MAEQLRHLLPYQVRARLWLAQHVDAAAIRLADSGHDRAAIALWRLFGMW
jgi:hypothetical protein